MDEQETTTTTEEAQAIAEAMAGYQGKARAQAPAEESVKEPAAPLADSTPPASEEDPDEEPTAQAEAKPADAIAQHLEDLKAQVKELAASKGADADAVRKMHGEIGNINRTLQKLKALDKANAPANDELVAAITEAEQTATEFPESAGPLVKAIKLLQSRLPAPAEEEDTATEPTVDLEEERRQAARKAAIEALDEVHPDRMTIKESPEFKTWYATWKTPEYRKRVEASWNPAVVAEPFSDWKATLAARKRKQDRLEAAATPQGLPHSTPSAISDEEAARRGYERMRGKRL